MIGPARIPALTVALAGMVLSMGGCNRLQARDQLNKGVESYKSARYEEAIGHFQKATELDPSLPPVGDPVIHVAGFASVQVRVLVLEFVT